MKKTVLLIMMMFAGTMVAQQVTISGVATDATKGVNAIEIVVNDTLSKIMADPKKGRQLYLKLYQNPRYVVRTDSTGVFKIKAEENDTLFFKSYNHRTQAISVKDLLRRKSINIKLEKN